MAHTAHRSNRTFMELKSIFRQGSGTLQAVLIVPLWNWNERGNADVAGQDGSNRTFMELKYGREEQHGYAYQGF